MIPDDNITALERLQHHQPKPGRIWPWVVALLMYLLWDSITGLGARIELLF